MLERIARRNAFQVEDGGTATKIKRAAKPTAYLEAKNIFVFGKR